MVARPASISLAEAAERLGVHYMTAYRYLRTGQIDAVQVGGRWQVDVASLDAFGREALREPVRRSRRRYDRLLTRCLVAGDEAAAWHLIQDALTSRFDPEQLYLDLLATALRQVGDDWAAGELGIGDEHRATATMLRLIGRLGPLFAKRGPKRGSVVLGVPAGDRHGLATALLADPLRGRGFAVVDLGGDTPPESFVEIATRTRHLVAVGLAATTRGTGGAITATTAALSQAVDAPVLVGGAAVTSRRHARRLGADLWSASAHDAVEIIEGLASGEAHEGRGELGS